MLISNHIRLSVTNSSAPIKINKTLPMQFDGQKLLTYFIRREPVVE